MRKITEQAATAFWAEKPFKSGNTRVEIQSNGDAYLYLHNNLIATASDEGLAISNAGWTSNTTKERLNGLLERAGINRRIYQKDWQWYICGDNFDWDQKIEFPTDQFFKV